MMKMIIIIPFCYIGTEEETFLNAFKAASLCKSV